MKELWQVTGSSGPYLPAYARYHVYWHDHHMGEYNTLVEAEAAYTRCQLMPEYLV